MIFKNINIDFQIIYIFVFQKPVRIRGHSGISMSVALNNPSVASDAEKEVFHMINQIIASHREAVEKSNETSSEVIIQIDRLKQLTGAMVPSGRLEDAITAIEQAFKNHTDSITALHGAIGGVLKAPTRSSVAGRSVDGKPVAMSM